MFINKYNILFSVLQKAAMPFLRYFRFHRAFTLVEMLMALLIISVIVSASLPIISQRTKTQSINYSKYSAVPIGMIAIWGSAKALPDNTWLECNGQAIPNGIEYEEIRQIYGTNLPDYRGVFFRGVGGNAAAIGTLQNDGIKEITLSTATARANSGNLTVYGTIGGSASIGGSGTVSFYAPKTLNTGIVLIGKTWVNKPAPLIEPANPPATGSWTYIKNVGGTVSGSSFKLQNAYAASHDHGYFVTGVSLNNKNSSADEVRPVNMAVRFIIKVKR